jgi:hypothetical protein
MPSVMEMYTVRQRFPRPRLEAIGTGVRTEVEKLEASIKSGARIAIAVGSRGIANLEEIVRATVDAINSAGGVPFIVPAMGSHGGATAEGQTHVLASYGITEENIGAPVVSSMEVVELPGGNTNKIFMDRTAFEADGIVFVNRIKPHTDFHDRYESGLVKMGVLGLGKHAAALEIHSFGVAGLRDLLAPSFQRIVATGKILFGLAVVENAYDETAFVEAIPGAEILAREPALLDLARVNMPCLPVEDIDVLVVDRLGKDISGVGMDPNIIGRLKIAGQEEPSSPRIKSIVVSSLSPLSYGNALGIGLADVITRKLYNAIDFAPMYANVTASLFLERAKVPFIAEIDRAAVELALKTCGRSADRVVRIKDTLHVDEVQVSKSVLDEIADKVELVRGPEILFDDKGELCEWGEKESRRQ